VSSGRLHYTFGPLERRGILGPIRLGQAVGLSLATLIAVLAIDLSPTAPGVLVSIAAVTAGAVGVFAPLASRTPQEWLPILATFAWRRISGRDRFASPVPGRGMLARWRVDGRGIALGDPLAVTPPQLHGVGVIEATYRQRPIGALTERSGRRLTAVLACRAAAFSLLDPEAQERRLARWGLVLSGAASSAVKRIQWIERTAPAQGDELARWVHAERDPSVPLRGTPLIDSYLELIGTTASVTQEHEILLAVQIDARSVRGDGEAATRTLIEESERIAQSLEAAEVTVLGALTAGQLARALRTAFDPYARAELTALETADPERDGLLGANAWPLGARESWDHYQTDGALHATYWIGAWPRVEVSPMFMAALLGRSSIVRTVAVTFEPIASGRSTREVEAAVTQDQADRELRRRFGQSETARQRQARDATVRRESELAAGHGEVRFTGFVTVSGRDVDELRRAGAELAEHAARARLELHRMYGQQADAFTFTLPLCRGLL
jgi:hypothetical protein